MRSWNDFAGDDFSLLCIQAILKLNGPSLCGGGLLPFGPTSSMQSTHMEIYSVTIELGAEIDNKIELNRVVAFAPVCEPLYEFR